VKVLINQQIKINKNKYKGKKNGKGKFIKFNNKDTKKKKNGRSKSKKEEEKETKSSQLLPTNEISKLLVNNPKSDAMMHPNHVKMPHLQNHIKNPMLNAVNLNRGMPILPQNSQMDLRRNFFNRMMLSNNRMQGLNNLMNPMMMQKPALIQKLGELEKK